jgi:hypothetical protein
MLVEGLAMIPEEDWKAVSLPGLRIGMGPRRFKWRYKEFRRGMQGKRLKHRRNITSDDKVVMNDMEMMHGGRYWPTTDDGLIALPYDSKKFDFEEWVED